MADTRGPITGMADQTAVLAAEETGWSGIRSLIDQLTPEQVERPGYYEEGWSAKDLLGHVGAWLAEAGVLLDGFAAGSYRREDIDVDDMNRLSLEAMRDIPFRTIKAQAAAARDGCEGRCSAAGAVPGRGVVDRQGRPGALRGAFPRLRAWVAELRST